VKQVCPAKAGAAIQVAGVSFPLFKGCVAWPEGSWGLFFPVAQCLCWFIESRCQKVRPAHRHLQMASGVGLQLKHSCEVQPGLGRVLC